MAVATSMAAELLSPLPRGTLPLIAASMPRSGMPCCCSAHATPMT